MSKPTKPPPSPFLVFAESLGGKPEALNNPNTPTDKRTAIQRDIKESLSAKANIAKRDTQAARHRKQVADSANRPGDWRDVYHGEALRHYYRGIAKSDERARFIAAWIQDERQRTKRRFAKDEALKYGLKFATGYRALQGNDIRRPKK